MAEIKYKRRDELQKELEELKQELEDIKSMYQIVNITDRIVIDGINFTIRGKCKTNSKYKIIVTK